MLIPPAAFWTPSTDSTFSSSPAGRVALDSGMSKLPSKASFGCTVTSTPALASAKIPSKALSTDPFSMKVPAIIATPSRIAKAVSAARSLRAPRPRRASAGKV